MNRESSRLGSAARVTFVCAAVLAIAALALVAATHARLFHSESASLSLHVLGAGQDEASARRQYTHSWNFARLYLQSHPPSGSKIRQTAAILTRTQARGVAGIGYKMERRIDIYGRDWDALLRYKNALGSAEPPDALVVPDFPRLIPTYGDLLILCAFAIAAICAAPLQFVREDQHRAGKHPVVITMHIALATITAIALWDVLDQKQPSFALAAFIGIGAAILLGRWLFTLTRRRAVFS